jgi:chromosome segregation ATPase
MLFDTKIVLLSRQVSVNAKTKIERRQHKDLKELQGQHDDAPRIIQVLREENNALKQKLKEYYVHLAADQRQIRAINKEVIALRVQNKQCHTLIYDEHLDERKDLTERLEQVETKLDMEVKHEHVC